MYEQFEYVEQYKYYSFRLIYSIYLTETHTYFLLCIA